jgi:hypothetical protein
MHRRSAVGLAALAALAVLALTAPLAGAGGATASKATCNGKSFTPVKKGNRVIGKGTLTCTGDVARMRLQSCLEQVVNGKFKTVACETRIRLKPTTVQAKVSRVCAPSVTRGFRVRSFLFLKDENGQVASGKVISGKQVFPHRC